MMSSPGPPSLGLSPALVTEIFDIITRLNKEQGLTILIVEQNANVALQVSSRGYVMEVGGIVMDGASNDLLESEVAPVPFSARNWRRWLPNKASR